MLKGAIFISISSYSISALVKPDWEGATDQVASYDAVVNDTQPGFESWLFQLAHTTGVRPDGVYMCGPSALTGLPTRRSIDAIKACANAWGANLHFVHIEEFQAVLPELFDLYRAHDNVSPALYDTCLLREANVLKAQKGEEFGRFVAVEPNPLWFPPVGWKRNGEPILQCGEVSPYVGLSVEERDFLETSIFQRMGLAHSNEIEARAAVLNGPGKTPSLAYFAAMVVGDMPSDGRNLHLLERELDEIAQERIQNAPHDVRRTDKAEN